MKKTTKILCLLLAAAMLFSLAACGGTQSSGSPEPASGSAASGDKAPEKTPEPTLEPTPEPTPEPEPEPKFNSVSLGGSISTDYVKITVVETGSGEKITEGNSSLLPSNESNRYFWLKVVLMNTAGEGFSLWNTIMPVEIVFDDKYTYEGNVWNFGSSTMAPLVENNVYLYAEVPPTILETYQTVSIRFGFNHNFAEYDYASHNYEFALENFDNLYEVTSSRDGSSAAEPEAEEESSSEVPTTGDWTIGYYVDEFNEPTDQGFVWNKSHWAGTFSNSATTDSLLYADVVADAEDITIFLYEYGKNTVKNSSSSYVDTYDITMKTADGTKYSMTGTIYCGGDRLYIDEEYEATVLEALQGEGDISFYIVKSDRTTTTYLFTMHISNFMSEYGKLA